MICEWKCVCVSLQVRVSVFLVFFQQNLYYNLSVIMASISNNTHIHISHLTNKTIINGACSIRLALLRSQELWDLVEEGYDEPESTREEAATRNTKRWALWESRKKDNKAPFTIYQRLDETALEMVALAKTSKEAWAVLNKTYSGVERAKKVWLQALKGDFEKLNKIMRQF